MANPRPGDVGFLRFLPENQCDVCGICDHVPALRYNEYEGKWMCDDCWDNWNDLYPAKPPTPSKE